MCVYCAVHGEALLYSACAVHSTSDEERIYINILWRRINCEKNGIYIYMLTGIHTFIRCRPGDWCDNALYNAMK